MMLWLRMMRCWIVQGLGKAVLWIVLIGGAGYAAYSVQKCPDGQTCVQAQKMKGSK
jgi:hypothetical protein